MTEILKIGIFEDDKRICFDVEASLHKRLSVLTEYHHITLAKLTRKLYEALLTTEETPDAKLALHIGDQETILHKSHIKER